MVSFKPKKNQAVVSQNFSLWTFKQVLFYERAHRVPIPMFYSSRSETSEKMANGVEFESEYFHHVSFLCETRDPIDCIGEDKTLQRILSQVFII